MTYISSSLVLTLSRISENAGRLCYKNIVTETNISATTETASGPASNMANPATNFRWKAADTSDQTITISNDSGGLVDYIGFARHNLDQPGLTLAVNFNGVTVIPAAAVSSVQAQLLLVNEATPTTIELVISGATEAPRVAVVYVGLSTRLERNIYVGHTPIVYGRNRTVINGQSQSGEWLGEVVLNETVSNSVNLQNLTPAWYRQELDPFFAQKPRKPCFYAWRPGSYPAEVGYCWVEGNPKPQNQRSNGMMSMSWNFKGIA